MCVCVCVCVCVHNIPLYIFVFAVYLLVLYICAQIRLWSCLVTNNFGLFTDFYFILSIVCFYTFFCIFLYGALCPRFGMGSCAIEMSIIIIALKLWAVFSIGLLRLRYV